MINNKWLIIAILGVLLVLAGIFFLGRRDGSDEVGLKTKVNEMVKEEIKELKIEDLKVGEGASATSGQKVTVHYTGTLVDGTKFDSSLDRGVPFSFELGAGEVIQGWDLGVVGMRVGGKRRLTIPSHLGYGERGAGAAIAPNSVLVFEIDLLEVK